jgi:HPt (histidine-containing phosphotransfer) domain-containing protein
MAKIRIRIPEELRDIAPNYLDRRKNDLAGLKDALARKDYDFIAKLSHKTKGTAGGYGFAELSVLAKALEMAAKSENPGDVETAIAAMAAYLAEVEIEP